MKIWILKLKTEFKHVHGHQNTDILGVFSAKPTAKELRKALALCCESEDVIKGLLSVGYCEKGIYRYNIGYAPYFEVEK